MSKKLNLIFTVLIVLSVVLSACTTPSVCVNDLKQLIK